MDMVLLLIKQNIVMFIYLLIGYFLFKKKLLTENGSGEIGKMLLYIIMPMAILRSYMREFSDEMLRGFIVSFVAAAGALLLAIIISRLFLRRKSAIHQFGAAFSNAGFIGIPLIQMTLGNDAVFYIASFVALLNILQWTYGVFIMTRDKTVISFGKIRTNPIVISFLAGLLLFFLPIRIPEIILGVVDVLASMNGPLAMIVLGAYLAQISLGEIFLEKQTYCCMAIRLIVIPFFTILGLLFVPKQYDTIRMAVLLAAAAPVGSNVAIFAQLYGREYMDAVKDVCLSTIFSIITLPAIVALADGIWKIII